MPVPRCSGHKHHLKERRCNAQDGGGGGGSGGGGGGGGGGCLED